MPWHFTGCCDRACPRASAGPGSGPAGGARQRSPAALPPIDPSCRGEGLRPSPSATPHPLKDRKARSAMRGSLFPPCGGPRLQARSRWPLRGHEALAARRPLPASGSAQHSSPEFFAFSGTVPRFQPAPRGVHKAASGFTKLPLSAV